MCLCYIKQKGGRFCGRLFRKRFSQTNLGVLRFPIVARARIRSVNRSPLGAASRWFETRYRSFTSVRAGSQELIPGPRDKNKMYGGGIYGSGAENHNANERRLERLASLEFYEL